MCIYFLILQFYVFHLNSFEIFFVCEEVLNHKEKGQVFTQSTLKSGDCILILHVLSFLECGLQIKKRYLSKFFFFFCKGFVVSEKWPVEAAFIAAWISHFPINYVYLVREKESQHHLAVIIERNVVVMFSTCIVWENRRKAKRLLQNLQLELVS